MEKAKLGKLNVWDWVKGALLTVGTTILSAVLVPLQNPPMHFPTGGELTTIGITGASTLVAYLVKQLATNSDGDLGKKEVQK